MTNFCVNCDHCRTVSSVTATQEPSYQCTGVVSEITGRTLILSCKEARFMCRGVVYFKAKEEKHE